MRRTALCLVALSFLAPAAAVRAQDKPVSESWDAAYLGNNKAGYVHTVVRRIADSNGETVYRARMELRLTVKRFTETVQLGMVTGNDETADGQVTAVYMKQENGKDQHLLVEGKVQGDRLRVHVAGVQQGQKVVPWNDEVVGLYGQERMFRERRVKPGMSFSYLSFEPTVNSVVRTRVAVKDYEEVRLPGIGPKQRLLRVEEVPDKIATIQLPTLTLWLNRDFVPVRSHVDMPVLGALTLVRTTRERALAPADVVTVDVGMDQLIRLDRAIADPLDTSSVVYRIRYQGDADPMALFAQDDRQSVKKVKPGIIDVQVRAVRGPVAGGNAPRPGPEFLTSSYFINSDDARVRSYADEAVGDADDAWEKATRIEKWVRRHMTGVYDVAFDTAEHVARTLRGDCTEYAVLTAAMCRAAGVPARTAIGLVYVDHRTRGPVMAFHMWTEVWVRGQWLPIDGTLGRGYVGASHLKISDHSWHDTQSLTPLLPTLRVLSSKISIQVLRVNGEE